MKKILILLLLCIPSFAYSQQFYGLSGYEDNYFTSGYSEQKHSTRFQISIKYALFYPYKIGAYISYTETCLWDLGQPSSPFYDYNHSPSAFLSLESGNNIFKDFDFIVFDYLNVGVRHKSNGRDGLDSRSENYWYVDGQSSFGNDYIGLGAYGKQYFVFKTSAKNRDLTDYQCNTEVKLFLFSTRYGVELFGKCGVSTEYNSKIEYLYEYKKAHIPWVEAGVSYQILKKFGFTPKLFIHYYYGYNSTMLDYNVKETSVRVGIKL